MPVFPAPPWLNLCANVIWPDLDRRQIMSLNAA
jgi:hypothetical protein